MLIQQKLSYLQRSLIPILYELQYSTRYLHPIIVSFYRNQIIHVLTDINQEFFSLDAENHIITNKLSLVDCLLFPILHTCLTYEFDLTLWSNIHQYYNEMMVNEQMKQAYTRMRLLPTFIHPYPDYEWTFYP